MDFELVEIYRFTLRRTFDWNLRIKDLLKSVSDIFSANIFQTIDDSCELAHVSVSFTK